MKKEIHPTWFPETNVVCACGHTYKIGSTVPELRVEICANCHPFFTGQEKLIDTERRVEKFEKRRLTAENVAKQKIMAQKMKKELEKQKAEAPKTLKEMLKDAKKLNL